MSGLRYSARIGRIPVYPAADGYALDESVALLASNEAPFSPLPEVVAAAQAAVEAANRYPDPGSGALRNALAQRFGVPADRVAVGNGSCDILLALGEVFLEPGTEVAYAWPSFSIYPHLAAASGAESIEVPLAAGEVHDLDAIAEAVGERTRLVVICNPNNPTGTFVSHEAIVRLLDRVPEDVCVVLDEAYREFVECEEINANVDLLKVHPNLAILRTFSKVYGLASLRVGYGLFGSTELRTAVDQVRQPFFCNGAAQAAAIEALRHPEAVAERVAMVRSERARLAGLLEGAGCAVIPSEANFLWVHLPDGSDEGAVVSGLAEAGILVRAGAALGGPGALRVTVGLPDQHDRLVAALSDLLS